MMKCPRCELNYIQDDQEACAVCMPPQDTYRRGGAKIPKPRAEGNIAFKCNYCDGGKNDKQIGYAGLCSKANIKENIEVKRRTWCSYPECKCMQYMNGQMTYEQLASHEAFCYESWVLIDWKASAGEDLKEGDRQGRHRKLSKDVSGGLCVLTTITPDMKEEKERIIFGVYIADKFEEGEDGVVSGFVQCTTKYKIKLAPAEAKRILFWNYYYNQTDAETAGWASGLFRYVDNYQAAQILRDIVAVKKGTADEVLVEEILTEYCRLKNLERKDIPDNNGALVRVKGGK